MNINTRNMEFLKFNNEEMQWAKFNGVTIYEAWKKLWARGIPPLTLPKCKGVDLVDYKIYGESVQDGIPTPETPIEIESVGEKTKNIYDAKTYPLTKGYWINGAVNGTPHENPDYASTLNYIPCTDLVGETITISRTGGSNPGVAFYDGNKTFISGVRNAASTNTKITATIPEGAVYYRFCVLAEYMDTAQINKGNTVMEYEPCGYKIPVVARGVNLINIDDFCNQALVKNNDGTYTLGWNGNYRLSAYNYNASVIKGGSTIVFNYEIVDKSYSENSIRMVIRYVDGTNKYIYNASGTSYKVDKDINFIYMYIPDTQAKGDYIKFKNFMTYYVEEAAPYEPYIEPVTTNIYLKEPLRKIGNYADYIDFKNSKIIRNTFARVYDGYGKTDNPFNKNDNEENWAGNENHGDLTEKFWVFTLNDTLPIIPKNGHHSADDYKQVPICLQLPIKTGYYSGNTSDTTVDKEMIWFCQQGRGVRLYLSKDRVGGTRSNILTYLRSNPITVLIATYQPYTEDITLPTIPTHEGTNIIEIDTSISPSNMEVEYYAKGVS